MSLLPNNTRELSFSDKEQAIVTYSSGDNLFNISSLSEFYRSVDSTGFAIKFVAEGSERYTVNKQAYLVDAGSYLLLNGHKEASVEIESKKNVKGICIHISTAVISDAVASAVQPGATFPDPELSSFFYTEQFLENQYRSIHTLLGNKLQEISRGIRQNTFTADDINTGLFFDLAERIVADQTEVYKQLQSIRSIKPETRRDLCRRLLRGREFIDSCFREPLSIELVAKEASMSEYHFFRLFKNVFGISPHQYILRNRLLAARDLLGAGQRVSDVAADCGFSDISSFSKTFKKHFGIAPSAMVNGK